MYLLDTNIITEILLAREKSETTKKFILKAKKKSLFMTDFSLYSLALLLLKRNKEKAFLVFMEKMIQSSKIKVLKIDPKEIDKVIKQKMALNLDFDDAYQYTVAEKHDLTIVSFDKDFDKTNRGRRTPAQILNS